MEGGGGEHGGPHVSRYVINLGSIILEGSIIRVHLGYRVYNVLR